MISFKIWFSFSLIVLFSIQSFGQTDKNSDSTAIKVEAMPNKQYTNFMILTKECKHCQDKFKIEIWINDNIYLNTIAIDSLVIHIPTAQPNDIISIKKYKYFDHTWNCRSWTYNRGYKFKIKNKPIIRIKSTLKVKSNYPHKKGQVNYDM
ncbi:hypothetical protein [Cytophaga aurantiaca]|uniref:hypothetical protein n=1 Tax=Cytophaga aurantiaca TaxID=29530 RepID=UPI000374326A|nr:hypothetical protein [Cytophaga aurantiaca]